MDSLEPLARSSQDSRGQILAKVAAEPHVSRSDLVAKLGLGPATVSTQVRRLIDMGVLREGPAQVFGTGRPRVPLEVVPEAGRAVGVGIDRDFATVAVVGADGAPLEVATLELPASSPQVLVAGLSGHIQGLVNGDPSRTWWGVSMAVSGVIDPTCQRVVISVVHGWRDVELAAMFRRATGIKALVCNDIAALASRELFRPSVANPSDFMLISIGYGVGMALVRDHHVLSGQRGASTEIGHVSVDPLGPQCACGNTGCLQVMVGLEHLQDALVGPRRGAVRSPSELAAIASATPRAGAVLGRAGYWLGRAIGGACTMTGLSTVLLTGQSLPLWPGMQRSFEAGVQETSSTLTTTPSIELRPWAASDEAVGAAGRLLVSAV